jgi:hypothetical protein
MSEINYFKLYLQWMMMWQMMHVEKMSLVINVLYVN